MPSSVPNAETQDHVPSGPKGDQFPGFDLRISGSIHVSVSDMFYKTILGKWPIILKIHHRWPFFYWQVTPYRLYEPPGDPFPGLKPVNEWKAFQLKSHEGTCYGGWYVPCRIIVFLHEKAPRDNPPNGHFFVFSLDHLSTFCPARRKHNRWKTKTHHVQICRIFTWRG